VSITSDALQLQAFGTALLAELELAPTPLDDDTRLVDDLGFDSVLLFELLLVIEDWIGVMLPEALLPHLETVGDVFEVYRTRRAQR
jgi:acyl carrier protein